MLLLLAMQSALIMEDIVAQPILLVGYLDSIKVAVDHQGFTLIDMHYLFLARSFLIPLDWLIFFLLFCAWLFFHQRDKLFIWVISCNMLKSFALETKILNPVEQRYSSFFIERDAPLSHSISTAIPIIHPDEYHPSFSPSSSLSFFLFLSFFLPSLLSFPLPSSFFLPFSFFFFSFPSFPSFLFLLLFLC